MKCFLLPALLLLATHSWAQTAPSALADSLSRRAQRAVAAKRYTESGPLFRQLAATTPFPSAKANAHYNAASSFALTNDNQLALQQLRAAYRQGWQDADWARQDENLASLRSSPEFHQLLARMTKRQARQLNPDHAQLVTTDIARFWRAYDRAARDTAHRQQIYQRYYFGKASLGLQDYYQSRIGTTLKFVRNLDRKPQFYRAIRASTTQVAGMTGEIRAGFRRLKELYPAARFPNVYFVIGRFTSMGTVSNNGMLISADMLAKSAEVPVQELSLWEKNALGTITTLPVVVAHEHIHTLQKRHSDPSLLRAALDEGMADFVAELTTGKLLNERQHTYGRAHEKELWAAFQQEMAAPRRNNWLYNSDQTTPNKPADLGYFIGYRICQAYYEQMPDKQQAVRDILNITDATDFLRRSGYAEKLAAL